MLSYCRLCPRNCSINRLKGEVGFCGASQEIEIAKVMLHQWEEPFISGSKGSGTIFFSKCNLQCVFCQNHEISQGNIGKKVSIDRLAEIFLEQEGRGAHNINLVTPTHYVPQIIDALRIAKRRGLSIPIVYNTNAYENPETILALNGLVDVYLPDLKYFNDQHAAQYSHAPHYFKHASKAIALMFSQVGELQFASDGMMKKGVVIRHLALPGLLLDSRKILDYIASNYGNSVYVCLMNQYTPVHKAFFYAELSNSLPAGEYEHLVDYCVSLGLDNVLIQEEGSSSKEFIPDFNLRDV